MSKKLFCLLLALLMLLTISCASAAEDIDGSSIAVVDEGDVQVAVDDAPLEIENNHADEEILSDSVDDEVLSGPVEEEILSDSVDDEVLSDSVDSDAPGESSFHIEELKVNEYGEVTITTKADSMAVGEVVINITDTNTHTVVKTDGGILENGQYVLGGTGFYLPKGYYEVKAHYYGDATFHWRDYIDYLTIDKNVADLTLDSSVDKYGAIEINAGLNQTATGTVTFAIVPEGEEPDPTKFVNVTVESGSASYDELSPFAKGKYTIYVIYNGDDNYYKAYALDLVDVNKTFIVPKTENVVVDHGLVTIDIDLGVPATGNVSITYPSGFVGNQTFSDGMINFYAPVDNEFGDVSLVFDYDGDENYYGFHSYHVDFFIKYDPNLIVTSKVNEYGIIEIVATVNETATGNMSFIIRDSKGNNVSGVEEIKDGSATYYELTKYDKGEYDVIVHYSGDEIFDDVYSILQPAYITKDYITPSTTNLNVNGGELNAIVDLGVPATGKVSVVYPSGEVENFTIEDGKVNIAHVFDTEKGPLSLVLDYDGDGNYYGFYEYYVDFFIKYDPNFDAQAKVNDYGGIEVLANLNKTATGKITVTIKNSTGDIVVSGSEDIVNGSALYYELAQYKKGLYNIHITYPGDGNFSGAEKDLSVEVTKAAPSMDYTVKVQGGEVTITVSLPSAINGKLSVLYPSGYVENVTIKNGSAKINAVFMKETGDMAITASFAGNDQYYAVERIIGFFIKQTTFVKTSSSISVIYKNNAKVTVKLTNVITNKAIAGAPVQITVNGKTYRGKTNKYGKAVITIPAKMVPKKYTARVLYKGTDTLLSDIYEFKLTVKKATPKLTAKKKTFKKSKKIKKYSVILKDNKGKAIKKAKLTIKVGKKKFTAKTNSKGKAVFKLKKLSKKAKYTAKITYNGNKYFKKLTKKVKIIIK